MSQDRRACAIRRLGPASDSQAAGAGWPGRFTEHGNRDAVAQESRDLRRFRCRFPGWVTGAAGPVESAGPRLRDDHPVVRSQLRRMVRDGAIS